MEKYVLLAALVSVVMVIIAAIVMAIRVCIAEARKHAAPSGEWEDEDFLEGGNNGYSLYVKNAPISTAGYYELLARKLRTFADDHPDLEIREVKANLLHGHLYATMCAMPRNVEALSRE